MWIDDEKSKHRVDEEIEFSEDEEEIERQEDYEREYNFRFEENAGIGLWAIREKLKNLKKKEINEKLEKIRKVAGIEKDGSGFLDEDDLEEDFDPEEYDRKMSEAFGDGYYEAEDVDPEFGSDQDEDEVGLGKPDFDKEDELLGLPKGWDEVNESGEGFMSARQRILKNRVADEDEKDIGEDGDDEPKEGKRKRKRKPSEVEKAVREQLMEEYYKLDYEDTIGDLKTRFKYKTVKAKRYGLTPEEVLMMDDKDLNQYVSLKKLAPYREKEWKVPRIKTIQLKHQTKKSHNGDTSDSINKDRKRIRADGKATSEVVNAVETEKSDPAQSDGDTSNLSRRSKRRRRQSELKLSRSRLMAYGKIPSKSKSNNQK
ncbi:UNVERIFIED_CONTAM: protein KRI1 [Sesamum latifolium]|uniref:Protein KRI1 n=1 Tax=Sesamum latifolium TaxID=2727402 RepID=A0AAW2W9V4_9LAMI